MNNDVLFVLELYFLGFVIATIMAALIKGIVIAIRRFSPAEADGAAKREEGSV
jgi:hypothetical protein